MLIAKLGLWSADLVLSNVFSADVFIVRWPEVLFAESCLQRTELFKSQYGVTFSLSLKHEAGQRNAISKEKNKINPPDFLQTILCATNNAAQ